MSQRIVVSAALLGSLALGGCGMVGSMTGSYDVDALRKTTAQGGTPFTAALTDEYRAYAINEGEKEYEWDQAGIFARKGLRTAKGEVVPPEDLSAWSVPPDRSAELTAARARLVAALDGGARERVPMPAAHAQAMFDCWVEEESEGDTASNCRAEFLKTEPLLQGQAPAPAPVAAPAKKTYRVYFDFNKSELTPDGRKVVDQLISDLKAAGGASVHLVGKADRTGSDAYNQRLSERRVKTVEETLAKAGISTNRVAARAVGEKEPPIATPDGVPELRNRVVEITVP